MKKSFVACLLTLVFSTVSFGDFLILPLDERINTTNIIVIGRLEDIYESNTSEFENYQATLVIEKIIYGNVKTTQDLPLQSKDKLPVKWKNSKIIACRLMFPENYRGIWFLQTDAEGNIEFLTPSSTTSTDDIAEINKLLKKQKRSADTVSVVRIQNDIKETPQLLAVQKNSEEVFKCPLYKEESKQKKYSPLSALLGILTSVTLFYLLYRSRFKIR